MNLVSILHERARSHPDQIAISDRVGGEDRSITFGELSHRVAAGARFLAGHGLQPGDTVLLFHPVRIELYEVLLSLFHAGMTAMLIDPSAGGEFIGHCCRRRAPDAYFGSRLAHLLRLRIRALRGVGRCFHPAGWMPFSTPWSLSREAGKPVPCNPGTPALITFTSGSTGAPKAAVRTHQFLHAQYEALSRSLHLVEGERDLVTLPVFVLANLAAGVTSVIADTDLRVPGQADADAIRSQCHRLGPARCTASPAFFERLLKHPDGPPPFTSLYTGGAPVFPDLLDRLLRALPGAGVHAIYGSTEAEPISEFETTELSEGDRIRVTNGEGLPAGRPVDAIDLIILPDQFGQPLGPFAEEDFRALALPPGKVGEIVVAGEHVLPGYLDGVGDQATKIMVGDRVWHRTGDAGSLDPDGRLWLHGRCAARLPGGFYPLAIEAALRDLPGHPRTALVAHRGITVVVEGQTVPREISDSIRSRFGSTPVRIVCLPEIPMDRRHNAKVDYPALRRQLDKTGL